MARTGPHMLPFPKGMMVLRIIQGVFALIALGLTGYGLSVLPLDGTGLELFAALATLITTIYILVASIAAPRAYNYWAILGLDIFCIIFWLVSAGYHGSEIGALYAAINSNYYGGCYYGYCRRSLAVLEARRTTRYSGGSSSGSSDSTDYSSYGYGNWYGNATAWGPVMLAAVGVAGLEVILFIISLSLIGVYLHRHRKNGGHCTPSRSAAYGADAGVAGVQPAGTEYYQYDKQQAQAQHVQV